jgi:Fe-S oxidoreductase
MASETVEAVTEILEKLDLSHALFPDDICCGFPLYEFGQLKAATDIAEGTLERIKAWDPDIVLTTCPACFRSLKYLYPEEMDLVVDFEVQHISEFLLPLVEGKLDEMPTKVTWHDPCVLGRHLEIYEQPRDVLKAVPGLELAEMPSNRKDALCCGAGGGVYFTSQHMANQAVVTRLEQAVETEAEQIITSCPNCYVRFRQMSRQHRMKIQAKSLAQIINEALD